ncbi:RodZ domain-containing protein [Ferruginivarius sediminum]|uniref:DUF4115 domain-containing protein n=1 Tax=Ferruginivarius sediminum TaxID=2661937 RepID=A0A369T9Y5_9PROT|nr:RodZ domain-containing protein [Ferruginivarius sediminum]RDD60987.1 DUF4115 domain-containing protein [Ferruginivarius sediminum]
MAEHWSHHPHDPGEPDAGEPTLGVAPGGGRSRETVGALLRRTRERFNLDLREAADQLRIRAAYLDAIERSDFDDLPGPTYAVGFVRSYADFLALDENEVVRRFKEEVEGMDRTQQLHFPKPVNEGKVPGGAILLISLVLIAVAYGGWYYMTRDGRSVSDLVPAVPERLQALLGTEAPEADGTVDVAGSTTAPVDEDDAAVAESGAADETAVSHSSDEPSGRVAEAEPEGDGMGRDDAAVAEASNAGTTGDADQPAPADSEPAESEPAKAVATGDVSETPETPAIPGEGTSEQPAGADGEAADVGEPTSQADETEVSSAPSRSAQAAEAEAPPAKEEEAQATLEQAEEPAASVVQSEEPADSAPPAIPESARSQDGGDSAIPAAPSGTQTAAREAEGRVFGAGNAGSRITVRATEDSWVQVRGPDDSLLLTRVLHAGDVYHVPDRPGLMLHTGNAGGLEVMVDGDRIAALGGTGEVRRNILLEPEQLRR